MKHPHPIRSLVSRACLSAALGLTFAASLYADAKYANASDCYESIIFPDSTKYELVTNAWNPTAIKPGWEIKIFTVGTTPTRNAWGYVWRDFSSVSGQETAVKAYPSVRMGVDNTSPSNSDGLPYKVSANKNVWLKWVFSLTGPDSTGSYTGVINNTIDVFFSSNGSKDKLYREGEIMIMPNWSRNASQWGDPEGEYTDPNGTRWYRRKAIMEWGNRSWPVYQYKRVIDSTSLSINLKDFINDVKNYYNPANWSDRYVNNIDAGTEIKWGSGRVYTSEYYSNVE